MERQNQLASSCIPRVLPGNVVISDLTLPSASNMLGF